MASTYLAGMYLRGRGVPADSAKAGELRSSAARAGVSVRVSRQAPVRA